ncbi:MAG: marine proteobacterial sortase target protein [Hahellaceae bacterium]|nr:marine proteobacterial sortase target protein [Hahellaceae bacterium]MCP5210272.1 marine proteobacterial sortase target protein [Hahellaceae bacterium]
MNWVNKISTRFWENSLLVFGLWLIVAAQSMAVPQEINPALDSVRPHDATMGELFYKTKQGYTAGTFLHGEVDIVVTGLLVKAHVRQVFENLTADWQEATYVFPLPDNAAVHAMRVKTGDRIIEGEIQEKAAARKTYNQAKSQGKRAALVEQQRPNMFTTDVSHIAPGDKVEVEIEYLQQLALKDGIVQVRFPTTITPRYTPQITLQKQSETGTTELSGEEATNTLLDETYRQPPMVANGWQSAGLESLGVAGPPVVLPADVARDSHRMQVKMSIAPGFMVDGIHSLTHSLHGNFVDSSDVHGVSGGHYEVNLGMNDTLMNRDLVVEWSPARQSEPQLALYTEQVRGNTYGLVFMTPPTAENVSTLARELIFVIDTSGSMGGRPMAHAIQVLHKALSGLSTQDRFNVIRFSSDASAFAPNPLPATAANVQAAHAYADNLSANGGTEMSGALTLALDRGSDSQTFLRQIVFITDGSVSNEQALFSQIEQSLGQASLFTVGIGTAPNSYFMRKAAEFGRGTFTQIDHESQIESLISQMLAKLGAPLLRDIQVVWPAGIKADVYPGRLPDLYAGDPLVFTFRVPGEVNNVDLTVQGTRADNGRGQAAWQKPLQFSVDQNGVKKGLDKLWARSRIAYLKDEHVRGVAKDVASKEILSTALTYGLVSDVTSLVAVDHTPVRETNDNDLTKTQVASLLPDGMANNMLRYPKTNNGSFLQLLMGALGLLFGYCLFWRKHA